MSRNPFPRSSWKPHFSSHVPLDGPFQVVQVRNLANLQEELNEKYQMNWKLVSVNTTADSGSEPTHVLIWDTRGPA